MVLLYSRKKKQKLLNLIESVKMKLFSFSLLAPAQEELSLIFAS